MEQLKYSLGPFELFSAIIGGTPLILAAFLFYNPVASVADLAPIIQNSGSVAIAITLLFLSYIIGGTIQGLSWLYFIRLCKLFQKDYFYYGRLLRNRQQSLAHPNLEQQHFSEFEERMVLQLQDKVGIPQKLDWMDNRLKAFLRERNSPSVAKAETLIASHIMYRNLSLGCLVLAMVSLINSIRLRTLEPLLIVPLLGYTAYLMFLQSVSFKRWHNRTLILGFYFVVTQESNDGASQ
ncbi:MAG: hypothetical protein AAF282_17990 [Cyanobacteria bacterium P01_A01_bin.15]